MQHQKKYLFPASLLFLFVLLFCSYERKGLKKKDNQEEKAGWLVYDSSACDQGLWKYVYNPDRLQVIEKCIIVTGIIKKTRAEEDGDQHMLLKLDDGQESLLKKRNIKRKKGDLVIEAVCMNNISDPKVGGACKGYVNKIKLPNIGDHVRVTGSYVIDTHNGWAEIHPASKIEVLH
jgi:hypothetical protein